MALLSGAQQVFGSIRDPQLYRKTRTAADSFSRWSLFLGLQQARLSVFPGIAFPNTDDYLVLRLARGLGEPLAARHFAVLASQYSTANLLCAYSRALAAEPTGQTPSKVFHETLASLPRGGGNGQPRPRLMAVRIERRVIGIAVFAGTHLEGFRVRHLASDKLASESATAAFIRSAFYENDCRTIAIESVAGEIRRSELHRVVIETCRAAGISIWELSGKLAMDALSHPSPKNRQQVRRQMLNMWPLPDLKHSEECVLDAFALGLYLQTERLLGADSLNGHAAP